MTRNEPEIKTSLDERPENGLNPEPKPEHTRRSRYASERDLERVLEESRKIEDEKRERQLQAEREKHRTDKEAMIPRQYQTDQERENASANGVSMPKFHPPLPWSTSDDHQGSDAAKIYDEGRVVTPPALATQDRWARIRRNAAERAAARQRDEQSRAECSGTTDNKDDETGDEETIESRVARIKARVAELTANMEETSSSRPAPPSDSPQKDIMREKLWDTHWNESYIHAVNNHVKVGREYSPPMVQRPPARDSDPERPLPPPRRMQTDEGIAEWSRELAQRFAEIPRHQHTDNLRAVGQYATDGTSSALPSSANPDEDWTKISDLAERRRIRNRVSLRDYRKKHKKRLEDLEPRPGLSDANSSYPNGAEKETQSSSSSTKKNAKVSKSSTAATAQEPARSPQHTPYKRSSEQKEAKVENHVAGIIKKSEPTSQEQLVAEVKAIYAGLTMVGQACAGVAGLHQNTKRQNIFPSSQHLAGENTMTGQQNDHSFWKQRSANVRALRPHLPRNIGSGLPSQEWQVQGEANGCAITALADTGANINAISKDDADRIGISPEPGTAGKTIRLPSGKTCLSLGTTNFNFSFDGEQTVHSIRCNVVEKLEYSMILCYDFLRKTETLTRFFKTRIQEVARSSLRGFSLCLLDDTAVCDGIKARMDGFINGTRARVVPDTGSGIMAVSASYARRLGLKVDTNRRTRVTFADGSSAITSGIVKAAWTFLPPDSQSELRPCLDDGGKVMSTDGKKRLVGSDSQKDDDSQNHDTWDYEWEYEWHVIDDLPVDAILSLDFIKEHDIFNRHEHAFVLIPPRSTLAELFGICELPGGNEGLRNLAEEFLADLASPDPFTYNMVVRESARRSEIQGKIRDLPLDAQATQLIIEQKRIDCWTRIHSAKVNERDWSRLRDDYLLSLRSQPDELILPHYPTAPTETALEDRPTRLKRFWRWRPRIP
ncbi:hypothetical protein F5Y01DRAFT_139962 [Xylaria sp. FL0043]|nr:hypothetical protein F5Y01DRAFT_139962 [Xylaria sp. FL0043]